jgi:hypothetical protein
VSEAVDTKVGFRCPPELTSFLPHPIAAVLGLPDWFKDLPQKAFSPDLQGEFLTIKKCPPVIDAMTYGFFMPLSADLKVENGEFSWQTGWPGGEFANISRSPISFHDSSQVAGTPFFDKDQFIIKFNSFWTIQLPPGYSVLITHPINRDDLPFRALTGLVDCDRYHDAFMQFPARWVDPNFNGVLPMGTPVVQCLPVKRESWSLQFDAMTEAEKHKVYDMSAGVAGSTGLYRHQFRAPKR